MALIFSSQSEAELTYDGVPTPIGDAVANATALLLSATASFYASLAAWEDTRTVDGQPIPDEMRMANARNNFDRFQALLKQSIAQFEEILNTTNEEMIVALGETLPGAPQSLPGDIHPESLLEENGYAAPQTYGDVVKIALSEAQKLQESIGEGFREEVRAFRITAYDINEAIRNAVAIGFAVGEYTSQ